MLLINKKYVQRPCVFRLPYINSLGYCSQSYQRAYTVSQLLNHKVGVLLLYFIINNNEIKYYIF
jgi:hypothetical protein